jgi:hypothetical protein
MNRANRSLLSLIVLMATAGVPAHAADTPDFTGMYIAQGTNPDDGEYGQIVRIMKHGDTFLVTWIVPQTSNGTVVVQVEAVGVGIVSGGALAVGYYTAQTIGVVVYRMEEGGERLIGQWTAVGGDGRVHAEALTRLPRGDSEPGTAAPADPAPSGRPAPPSKETRSL